MRALDDEHAQLLGAAPIRSAVRAAVAEIGKFTFRPYVRTRHAPPGGSRSRLLELASVAPLLFFMASALLRSNSESDSARSGRPRGRVYAKRAPPDCVSFRYLVVFLF
jgi:hypothetical protein